MKNKSKIQKDSKIKNIQKDPKIQKIYKKDWNIKKMYQPRILYIKYTL
jgi:hypothetical protein